MPVENGAVTAPPVTPQTPPANAPNAPRTSGTDTLRNAIRAFGEKYTITDDSTGSAVPDGGPPPERLPERLQQQPVADGADDGAADDGAAPSASGPVQGADGKWRNADGSFARDPAAPDSTVDDTPPARPTQADDDPDTVPFVLKGLTDRGEVDEEIDVPKGLEERFRRLSNDANRYREVSKRLDTIEAKEADFQILEARMRVAPDAFVLSKLSPEVQQRLAVQLVAEHWDAIVKDLVRFDTDPSSRQLAAKDNQIRIRDGERAMEHETQKAKAATRALRMIEDLVPDGASPNRAARFVELAKMEIDREYQNNRGAIPAPDRIKSILADVARDMGFDSTQPTEQTDGQQRTAVATNGSKPAAAPQAKAQGTARTSKVDERKAQTQRSRVMARRMTPAGAGGAPTMAPTIPPTSQQKGTNPLKERFAFLRANPGILRQVDTSQG